MTQDEQDRVEPRTREAYERVAGWYRDFIEEADNANNLAEVPAMRRLIGDVRGLRILDLGCGQGRYSIWCAQWGARVVGLELSERMVALGRAAAERARVTVDFRVGPASDLAHFPSASFDGVVSGMAVDYFDDLPAVAAQIHRVLRPGGWFVFSVCHPIRLAGERVETAEGPVRIVSRYFEKGVKEWRWMRDDHHELVPTWGYLRTVADYVDVLAEAGFLVERLWEPEPVPEARELYPGKYADLIAAPQFLLIRAIKPRCPQGGDGTPAWAAGGGQAAGESGAG